MKIQELETHSGLDRATIRFYEKEELISPARLENGYRDYSEDDLRMLLKIKLLRRLGVSLETIKELQQGSGGLQDILPAQIRQLQQKITTMERAVTVCKNMQTDGADFASLDASLYLKMLEEQTKPQSFHFREEYIRSEYHPVLRYVARMIDYLLVRMALQCIFIVLLRIRPYEGFLQNLVLYGAPFLSVPLTAWMLSAWGTTPGKWLMGMRVEAGHGALLTYQEALQREWDVLRYGYGFGIPFYAIWRQYISYRDYGKYDDLFWEAGGQVQRFDWNGMKKAAFTVFCFLYIISTSLIAMDLLLPKHRSDELTVSQFAENYNYYASITEYGGTLNADGTWKVVKLPENSVVISLGNKSENENDNFLYETEGERITRISYQNAWQEVTMLSPVDKGIITACFTAVTSQEQISIAEFHKFLAELQAMEQPSGQYQYRNIEIRWNIDSENCIHRAGVYYTKDRESPSRVAFEFEIIIH